MSLLSADRHFVRLRGWVCLAALAMIAHVAEAQAPGNPAMSETTPPTITIRLSGIGAAVSGPTRVTGSAHRIMVRFTGYNPLNPTTYQITSAGTPVVTTDAETFGWVAKLLGWPGLTAAPPATQPLAPVPKTDSSKAAPDPKKAETETQQQLFLKIAPTACRVSLALKTFVELRQGLATHAEVVAFRAQQLNDLRQDIVSLTTPLVTTQAALAPQVAALRSRAEATQLLPDSTLTNFRVRLAEAVVEMDRYARESAVNKQCSEANRKAVETVAAWFHRMERDAASVQSAQRSVASLTDATRYGLARWAAVVSAEESFWSTVTIDPPVQASLMTITVQRVTPAPSSTPSPLTLPVLASLGPPEETIATTPVPTVTAPPESTTPAATAAPSPSPTVNTVLTTSVIHDVRPTVSVSAGATYALGYRAPSFTTQDVTGDSVRLIETEAAARQRMAPLALLHIRLLDHVSVAVGGTLTKGPGTEALSIEPFVGVSFAPTRVIPNSYLTAGVVTYRAASLRDSVLLDTTYKKADAPPSLYRLVDRATFAVAVSWRVR